MPRTVAHVITKLELGGAQQNTLFTVSHLDPSRYRRILVTGEPGLLDDEAGALPDVEWHRVPSLVRPISPARDARAVLSLTRLFLRCRPAIVHTHSSKAGLLGRWAAALARVPIVVHSIHGFGFHPYQWGAWRRLLIAAERSAARVTSRFFAVSEATRRTGVALGLFPADRCTVIRSGVPLDAIRSLQVDAAAIKRGLGFRPEQPLVGMVGPLKAQKAPLDFVRLAGLVHHAHPDAGFVLVGDGELRRQVEMEIVRLGLSGVVRLAGWRRDVPALMHAFAVFALTSRWEGLPRVYLEALAAGTPVVGTAVDGAAEVVHDGVNGYLVAPGDVPAMAEKVVTLLSEPALRGAMGRRAREVPQEFDIDEMVRRQDAEYERLLTERAERISLRRPEGCDTPATR